MTRVLRGPEQASSEPGGLPPRYRGHVRPVLCRTDDHPSAESVDGVLVTTRETLEHILRSSPVVLSP